MQKEPFRKTTFKTTPPPPPLEKILPTPLSMAVINHRGALDSKGGERGGEKGPVSGLSSTGEGVSSLRRAAPGVGVRDRARR